MIENIKKVIDKVPTFIKTIVNKLFGSQSMNLNFFIQQYDEDYKLKTEKERLKNLKIFKKRQRDNLPNREKLVFESKNNDKNKDDFEMSR